MPQEPKIIWKHIIYTSKYTSDLGTSRDLDYTALETFYLFLFFTFLNKSPATLVV